MFVVRCSNYFSSFIRNLESFSFVRWRSVNLSTTFFVLFVPILKILLLRLKSPAKSPDENSGRSLWKVFLNFFAPPLPPSPSLHTDSWNITAQAEISGRKVFRLKPLESVCLALNRQQIRSGFAATKYLGEMNVNKNKKYKHVCAQSKRDSFSLQEDVERKSKIYRLQLQVRDRSTIT